LNNLNRQKQRWHIKFAWLIGIAVLFCYFFSEAVLRQFVLHRAGVQAISLSSILGKLPPGIRDEVSRQITIAELKDELKAATTTGKRITISIRLAGVQSPQHLQERYAEVIDQYPAAPEALPAFTNFLMAPETALKSISIRRYHEFIKTVDKQQLPWAWSAGLAKLKSLKVSQQKQLVFLMPLLDIKPDSREYQQLYIELTELAFQENNQAVELQAKELDEMCEKLPFFDEQLEKKAKAKARKLAKVKAKAKAEAEKKTTINKSTERKK
jgi:hypothetical protein